MDQAIERVIDVVMWGASQTGKTTALAAYLCDTPAPSWLDRSAQETRSTLGVLSQIWNALQENRILSGTRRPQYYEVRSKNKQKVRFRDMMGGNARDLVSNPDDVNALQAASAVILFVEWPNSNSLSNKVAVANALRIIREDCPVALAITKVEWFLTPQKLHEFMQTPLRVAEEMKLKQEAKIKADFLDVLKLFDASNIFPITVYGYSANDYPAHYRDEFGRLVPWGVKPLNVASPFEHVLNPLI